MDEDLQTQDKIEVLKLYNIYIGLESLWHCIKKQEKYTTLQVEVNKMHERFNNKSLKRGGGGESKTRIHFSGFY